MKSKARVALISHSGMSEIAPHDVKPLEKISD
jgi:hypothetical protein